MAGFNLHTQTVEFKLMAKTFKEEQLLAKPMVLRFIKPVVAFARI